MAHDIRLRSFTQADFHRLISWIDTPELLIQWAGPVQFTFPLTTEQLRFYLVDGEGAKPVRHIWTALTGSEEAFGHIEIGAIDHVNHTGSLCRVLVSSAFQGKGLSGPMVREALRIGFDELRLERIELKVFSFNTAAITCYQRMGFVETALLKNAVNVGESSWDTKVMALLRDEWNIQRIASPPVT